MADGFVLISRGGAGGMGTVKLNQNVEMIDSL